MTDARAVAAAYDARAGEYASLFGDPGALPAADRELIEAWREPTRGPLLDAGCGPGHWTHALHEAGRDALGVDASSEFLRLARRRHPGVAFARGTLAALPVADAGMGGVLAWYSVIHTAPEAVPEVLGEFARVLAPGGRLLLGYFAGQELAPFDHAVTRAWFWPTEELARAVESAAFVVLSSHERQDEGHRRHGDLTAVRVGGADQEAPFGGRAAG